MTLAKRQERQRRGHRPARPSRRQDEPADELGLARGEGHRDVAAERQADDDRPAVRSRRSRIAAASDVGRAVERERLVGPRAVAPAGPGRSSGTRRTSAACWAAHIAPVSRVPWTKTMAGAPGGPGDDRRRPAATAASGHGPSRPSPCSTANSAACVRLVRPELGQDVRDVGPRRPLGDPELRRRSPGSTGRGPTHGRGRRARGSVRRSTARRSRRGAGLAAPRARSASGGRRSRRRPGRDRPRRRCAARIAAARSSASASLSRNPLAPASMRGRDPVLLDEAGDGDDLDRRVARP